jgi:DNA-binding SARP family transcriptional activator/tetratricopeptide (TPR) repeat protein
VRLEFRILGPIEMRAGGDPTDLGGPRLQRILAALLLDADRAVSMSRIVAAVWDGAPPATARRQIQDLTGQLRRALIRAGAPATVISTTAEGYRLDLDGHGLDARRFDESVAAADAAEPAEAARLLRPALALWRGPALGGLDGTILRAAAAALDERRVATHERCLRLELNLARPDMPRPEAVAAEAALLVTEHPYRESLVEVVMTALNRTGRRADALDAYHQLRERLVEELGLDPGPDVQRLHQSILRGEFGPADLETAPLDADSRPAQLPMNVKGFHGRRRQLGQLDALAGPDAPGEVIVLSGPAGVGKTTLAVHWAHQVRDRYPHGQLFVNLAGAGAGEPMAPLDALRGFLVALGVDPGRAPTDTAQAAALYRTRLAQARVLVVLDNAWDAEQVRPLLPGSPGCTVLVTSRRRLGGLVAAEAARPLDIDVLSDQEAAHLLANRLGDDRVAAEPRAVGEILSYCAGLPLALVIIAARAMTHPSDPLHVLATELATARGQLDPLTSDDPYTDLRTVFSWSYRTLSEPAARLFRLLSLHPGGEFAEAAAASLVAELVPPVRRHLAELERARLLGEPVPGRYAFHDLVRAYAGELAATHDPDGDRRAALGRLLDHYLRSAHAAERLLYPHRRAVPIIEPDPRVTVTTPADHRAALALLDTECRTVITLIHRAEAAGFDTHAWQLTWAIDNFLERRGRWADWADIGGVALAAARRSGDPLGQLESHRALAAAALWIGTGDESAAHLTTALELAVGLNDLSMQGRLHLNFGMIYDRHDEPATALPYAQRALELFERAGDRTGEARALNAVGWTQAQLGDFAGAVTACRRALALQRAAGDERSQAATWDSLGYAYHRLGEHRAAIGCYERSIELSREFGNRFTEADVLTHLAEAHLALADLDRARTAWRDALLIFQDISDPREIGVRTALAGLRARA